MNESLAIIMQLIVQAFFTLAVFSFLYRDNPIYRFAEHTFVGVAAGYGLVVQFHTIFLPNLVKPLWEQGIAPADGQPRTWGVFLLLIPGILGFMMFFKFFAKTAWLARWPMAVVIGAFAGTAILGAAQGDLIPQIQANILPIIKPGAIGRFLAEPGLFSALDVLYNPVLIVGVACCLVYFFFSSEHRGATGVAAGVGIWFLMISFGASYGSTVATRVSLFLERAFFLLKEPTLMPDGSLLVHWKISIFVAAAVIAFLVVYRIKVGPERIRGQEP